ncbi:MAG: hypothetical protein M0Z70_00335 [Nitrospiraceae bacterium]|jgi:hypothetical protein|nr:hypothetical protein [Nitrospirota bacterium]MDA8337731.1 hypothetical protein [Nitrospiraceae bacterium]
MEKWEYKSLEWIHKAREEEYNKTKNLTPKELIEKTRKAAEETAEALGLKVVKSQERVH